MKCTEDSKACLRTEVIHCRQACLKCWPSCAGKLHQAAHKAHSRQEIISILDDMFPPTRSAAKGNALKEAFAAVCPGLPWKVGHSSSCIARPSESCKASIVGYNSTPGNILHTRAQNPP